ncbi:uncharacterized protein LOC113789658 [Dermatophagoides pteronyssinus]|uniref:uncharacterized protein LOC113789658 n=1 Tax=Dermatophagoides pteronyssinus TaxID=6956 RepID=UPI003F6785AB
MARRKSNAYQRTVPSDSDAESSSMPNKSSKMNPENEAHAKLENLCIDPSPIATFDIDKCCDILDLFNIGDKRSTSRYISILPILSTTIRALAFTSEQKTFNLLEEIKQNIKDNNKQQPIPISYAQMVRKEPQQVQMIPKQEKTIIIKPNNNIPPPTIEYKIRDVIKQSDQKVKINKMFSKKNCVIIKVPNIEQDPQSIIDKINNHEITKDNCKAYAAKMRDPTILVKNVPSDTDLDHITEEITDCNQELNGLKDEINYLFKLKYGDNTAKNMNVVLRVSPKVYNIITNQMQNKIYLNFQGCYVQTKIFVRQCQKCFEFNHKTTDCKNTVICKNCGQQKSNDHTCSEIKCCINCKNSIKHKDNTTHCPNTESCPIYKLQKDILNEQTQYSP